MKQRTRDVLALMGKVVLVTAVFRRITVAAGLVSTKSNRPGRLWKPRKIEPRPGWVVGSRWIQIGHVVYGCYDEPAHFEEAGPRQFCLLVVGWPSEEPMKVPWDGFKSMLVAAPPFARQDIPIMPWEPYPAAGLGPTRSLRERYRKMLQKEAKEFPRDAHGRWTV